MSSRSPLRVLRGLGAPSLQRWSHFEAAAAPESADALRVRFLGVSTLVLTDTETTILTDGYFSRPSLPRLRFGRVRPDQRCISHALRRFGIGGADAVFVVHSHVDHALDSATVAGRLGARLHGSASTERIARGDGLPADRFEPIVPGRPVHLGRFTVTAHLTEHAPGDLAPGDIDAPLPARPRATDYRSGDCYTLHVRHDDRELLIQSSANSTPGALADVQAETVFLGIGTLGVQSEEFRETYWERMVVAPGARTVVPIHWDDFSRSLDRPLRPFPRFFDDFDESMRFLERRAAMGGVRLTLPTLGTPIDPWL